MASRRVCQALVLCEDQEHATLAVRYLRERFKLSHHAIHVTRAPPAGGSAEQFVRNNFSKFLQTYRRRANHHALCLLVLLDADTSTVELRVRSLVDIEPRLDSDRIAIFVPKRNVETWAFEYAEGSADEDRDYGPQGRARLRTAAEKLARNESTGLPSIDHALTEARRLDDFGA